MKRVSKHRYRAVGLVVVAAMAFSAVAAGSASALTWYTRSPETAFTNGQEETVTPSATSGFVLEGSVGSTPLKIEASTLTGESTKIKQSGSVAADSGRLIFKNLTVKEPATCTAPTEIKTTELKSELVPVAGLTSGLADKFLPVSGELFTTFKLGGSCAIAGTIIQVKTTKGVFGETNAVGVYATSQKLVFSPAINSTAGGNLFTGANAAKLSGQGANVLSGVNAGKEWAAK